VVGDESAVRMRLALSLLMVVVVSVGVVVVAASDRPTPPPDRIRFVSTTEPTLAPLARTNVYRTVDGHCFGMDPAAAARSGLRPDPRCTP
jgi:hypothetical protein